LAVTTSQAISRPSIAAPLTATVLAVYKRRGMISCGRPKQREVRRAVGVP
jgi:hypothetical protein